MTSKRDIWLVWGIRENDVLLRAITETEELAELYKRTAEVKPFGREYYIERAVINHLYADEMLKDDKLPQAEIQSTKDMLRESRKEIEELRAKLMKRDEEYWEAIENLNYLCWEGTKSGEGVVNVKKNAGRVFIETLKENEELRAKLKEKEALMK